MKISTKGRYGTRALVDIAIHQGKGPVLLKSIAAREQISLPYLERIIASMVKAGFLKSTRGPNGGISLSKSPEEIRLSHVLEALEGSLALVECVEDPRVCSRANVCVTCEVWSEMKKAMDRILESTTLQDLLERHKQKESARLRQNDEVSPP